MAYSEVIRRNESPAGIEQRNQEMLTVGRRAGTAIVTLLPLIRTVTRNWSQYYPFDSDLQTEFENAIQQMRSYCSYFYPTDEGSSPHDELGYLTQVVSLNLDPKPIQFTSGRITQIYEDKQKPMRLRNFLQEYAGLIRTTFSLPDLTDSELKKMSDTDLEQKLELIGAPRGFEGLRFLPGYRKMSWGKTDEKAGSQFILFDANKPVDMLWFEKQGGRTYFIASTGGLTTLDQKLQDYYMLERISVTGLKITDKKPTGLAAVVVDKDDTIAYENYWDRDDENVKAARTAFFHRLGNKHTPVIIWSRNYSVSYMQTLLESSLGIRLPAPITFENWPFSNRESHEFAFNSEELTTVIYNAPATLRTTIIQYVRENMGVENGYDYNYYADILFNEIKAYFESHLVDWKTSFTKKERLLEAKAPLFVGLTQLGMSDNTRIAYVENGTLVNNDFLSLESAKIFGYNFIHVNWVPHVDRAAYLLDLI